jgi:hypothetical protein
MNCRVSGSAHRCANEKWVSLCDSVFNYSTSGELIAPDPGRAGPVVRGPARFGSCGNWPNDHSVSTARSACHAPASFAVTAITNLVFDSPLFFGRRVIFAVRYVYQRGDCDHQGGPIPESCEHCSDGYSASQSYLSISACDVVCICSAGNADRARVIAARISRI